MKTIQIFNYYIELSEADRLTQEFEKKIFVTLREFIQNE